MEDRGMTCIKYLMFIFNFIFWLCGLAMIIVGAIIRANYGDYFSYADSKFATAPVLIIVAGVIVFVIGFLGCCGAIKENYCMVTTFAVLIAIIFIFEIVVGALGFAYKSKVEDAVEDALERAVRNYNVESGAKELLDWAQKEFKCCGYNGTYDGGNSTCADGGVKSCHADSDCNGTLYTESCEDAFVEKVKDNLKVVGAVVIAIAFVQLLGIIFACCMMKSIKGGYEVV